uniref:Protein kinase domain-containing protein n=2 Tax=Kalanchoe fedtschenkoi TaxID=63787 RepID=A0A7N0TL72_KALFE
MGGACVKGSGTKGSPESPREGLVNRGLLEKRISRANSLKKEEGVVAQDRVDSRDVRSIEKRHGSSKRLIDDRKRRETEESVGAQYGATGSIPKALHWDKDAPRWPSWLLSVAREAVKGWVPRHADTFERIAKIGQGTYSNVYKARDTINGKIVALKRVRFDNQDPESVKFMAREIILLRRLDHPNVIKLEGLIASEKSSSMYLIFEYMEHDLTGLASIPSIKFTEPQVKCYMQQLLSGLDYCHRHGILHRDIKGSNLLIDNNGILKIADFGLASFFDPYRKVQMTSHVVTLWYRPLELILGATQYGVGVDLWSVGCILGELYYGRPIMPGKTEVEQLHKIFKLCGSPSEDLWRKSRLSNAATFKPRERYRRCIAETFKDFPTPAIRLIETLLSLDPAARGTAARALKSEYFSVEPRACDPSDLPNYPPNKERDAKLRQEEARRRKEAGGGNHMPELENRRHKESQAAAAQNKNTEAVVLNQKQRGNSNPRSGYLAKDHGKEGSDYGLPNRHTRKTMERLESANDAMFQRRDRGFRSGPLGWIKSENKADDPLSLIKADLSMLSGLVAARTTMSTDRRDSPLAKDPNHKERLSGPLNDWSSAIRQDIVRHAQTISAAKYGKPRTRESTNGNRARENSISFSGPLVSPNNVDQVLKEHDHKIQQYARRARLEKSRAP